MSRVLRPLACRAGALALGLALTGAPGAARAQDPASPAALAIDHDPPGCVVAGKYAVLTACFRPHEAVARGRVYFRAQGSTDWLYVEMTGVPPCLEAVLPRPREDLGVIEYAIAVLDRDLVETRTAEHAVPVTESDVCRSGPVAPAVESATVIIGSTGGSEPVGFLTGRGVSTGLILGMAGGAAAVATLVVVTRHDSSPDQTSSWLSELAVSGGRGRVVVDGAQASFPGPGAAIQPLALTPGPHRFEAELVAGDGRPGSWRFDLSSLAVVPGSLGVAAGDVAQIGPDQVAFRLTGQPGERVVFEVRVPGK